MAAISCGKNRFGRRGMEKEERKPNTAVLFLSGVLLGGRRLLSRVRIVKDRRSAVRGEGSDRLQDRKNKRNLETRG